MSFYELNIDRLRGSGSFYEVYDGTFRGQLVTIEKFDLNRCPAERNFDLEIETMLQLDHPNVLKLLDWQIDYHIRYTTTEHFSALAFTSISVNTDDFDSHSSFRCISDI
jgi:hypothetical protein